MCSLDKFNLAQLDFTIKSFFCYSKVAQNNNLQFFETSAKTGDGVKEVVSILKKSHLYLPKLVSIHRLTMREVYI